MMDLSIIVPAYNASTTINETLASLEVIVRHCVGKLIIVDDGSTDGTINIVEKWQKKLNEKLLVLKHDNNLGGGATRNTGINAADTTYVLVCDSDDISDLESVKKLYNVASNHEWGCAHYQYARYFRKNHRNVDSIFDYLHLFQKKSLTLKDVLTNVTLVNFLFKKENWQNCNGYPQHHGWDTQGFSIKYLMNNPGVLIVPNTFYSHRRFSGNLSYYERESLSGRTLLNDWLVAEEIISLEYYNWFDKIMDSQILSKQSTLQIIKENIQRLESNGNLSNEIVSDDSSLKIFINAIVKYKESNFNESKQILANLLITKMPSEIILFTYLRSVFAESTVGKINANNLAFEFLQNIGKGVSEAPISRSKLLKQIISKTFQN